MRTLAALVTLLVVVAPASALASPFSPGTLDAQIQQCIADIDADSLFSYIQALQDRTTRHTSSDTTSATTGIGSARRYVHDKFLEFQGQGGNLVVSYHDFTTPMVGVDEHRNVVAEIPGTEQGTANERIYVIGGHLDSRNEDGNDVVGSAYGADDDASGVACAMELARVMSMKTWPMTFRFIAFVGEEQGLVGSQFYAIEARWRDDPIAAMLNNDTMASIIGAPHPDSTVFSDTTLARCFAAPPEESSHRQLQRYLKAMGDSYVPVQDIVLIPALDRPSRGGDHESFVARDYTAVRYMEYLEEVWRQHTTDGDTLGPHLDKNYLRRNAQVDLATLGSLALSPSSPTGLAVADVGDSTGFRLTWPSTNPEGDLAGYLVTVRSPGSLDYEQVIDVGLVNEYVHSTTDESLWFGLSIRNTGDHRALVMEERLGVLSSVPGPPEGLVVSPDASSIGLSWTARAESDLAGYRVYRSATSGSGYAELTTSPVPSPSFTDLTATPHDYHYYVVTAEDIAGNESAFSEEVYGRLVTLDSGILLVDETRNGTNAWFPSDAAADAAYAAALSNHAHDVWDYDDDGAPTLSDLGPYSTVIWAADDYNRKFQGFTLISAFLSEGTPALDEYVGFGGNAMIAGWEPAQGHDFPEAYTLDLSPGNILYDHFGLDDVAYKRQKAFTGGTGQGTFADVLVDPDRTNPNWQDRLTRIEYFTALRPGASVAYLFDSIDPDSVYHQQPCAVTYDGGSFRTVYLGFPLYHLLEADARAMIDVAMTFLGEGTTDVEIAAGAPVTFSLSPSRPNPFRDETEIRFAVPVDGSRVSLTVFDVMGRRVRTLVNDTHPAGRHAVRWDGTNEQGRPTAAGVYFYRLVGTFDQTERELTRKMLRLR